MEPTPQNSGEKSEVGDAVILPPAAERIRLIDPTEVPLLMELGRRSDSFKLYPERDGLRVVRIGGGSLDSPDLRCMSNEQIGLMVKLWGEGRGWEHGASDDAGPSV